MATTHERTVIASRAARPGWRWRRRDRRPRLAGSTARPPPGATSELPTAPAAPFRIVLTNEPTSSESHCARAQTPARQAGPRETRLPRRCAALTVGQSVVTCVCAVAGISADLRRRRRTSDRVCSGTSGALQQTFSGGERSSTARHRQGPPLPTLWDGRRVWRGGGSW